MTTNRLNHGNLVVTSWQTHCVSITNTSQLSLYTDIIGVL